MKLVKIECYVVECDRCGERLEDGDGYRPHFDSEEDARDYMTGWPFLERYDWQDIDGQLVCHGCWEWGEDGEMVVAAPLVAAPAPAEPTAGGHDEENR